MVRKELYIYLLAYNLIRTLMWSAGTTYGTPPFACLYAPFRKVLNTQLYVLITGCRWCDVPQGEQWATKSSAHRWLKRWYENGTLKKLKGRILAVAEEKGMIDWKYGAVDGSFSPA